MPAVTKPSPSRVGRNRDFATDAADGDLGLSVFDIITKGCHSPYEDDPRRPGYEPQQGPRDRFIWGRPRNHFKGLPILASSFDGTSKTGVDAEAAAAAIITYNNGFVEGLIRAFNQDLHLVVRPDDVWQAILSQFSLFVNGNADRLRHLFVAHESKRTLTVDLTPMHLANLDLGAVAQEFVSAIQANVVDAELKEWMLPAFSTTTDQDRVVAAFGTMGALQQYFDYQILIGCGLPSVTLLGEHADWAALADRVERLPRYGDECARWAELLRPVMRHFLLTFRAPDSPEVRDFWLHIAHEAGGEGSGVGIHTLSGWITAFAYFNEDGKVTKDYNDEEIRERMGRGWGDSPPPAVDPKRLVLDGATFPVMRRWDIPRGVIVLPMTIQDLEARVNRFITVISGSIGMSLSAGATTVQPVSAWWVVQEFEKPADPLPLSKAGSSVTGSTTEGTSGSRSTVGDTLEAYDKQDMDSEFDDSALP